MQAIRVDSVAGLTSLRAAAQPRAVHYGQQSCWAGTDKSAGFKESAKEARQRHDRGRADKFEGKA